MSDEVVSNEVVEKREKHAAKAAELASILRLAGEGTDTFNMSRPTVLKKLGVADSAAATARMQELDSELRDLGADLQNAEMKAIRDRNRERAELRGEPADEG